MNEQVPIIIATRGSPLAMAQSNMILALCRQSFPDRDFELKIVKTTGDRMQTSSVSTTTGTGSTKGLFTKELEMALLNGEADIAVHSLKDLPTDLPTGLVLGAIGKREDVRDVLVYRERRVGANHSDDPAHLLDFLPPGAVVGTCSTRRKAQFLELRPDLTIIEHRGNVLTRITKLEEHPDLDATILAAAGLNRLGYRFKDRGQLNGERIPDRVHGKYLDSTVILPCVGQAALGIEVRFGDKKTVDICKTLNDPETEQCVTAERAFLASMGGGCQSPVAALAVIRDGELHLAACNFEHTPPLRAKVSGSREKAVSLGQKLAKMLGRNPAAS